MVVDEDSDNDGEGKARALMALDCRRANYEALRKAPRTEWYKEAHSRAKSRTSTALASDAPWRSTYSVPYRH